MHHPIRVLLSNGFDDFLSRVKKEVEIGNVNATQNGDLLLLDYSRQCQFDEAYNEVNEVCRGLILDTKEKKIVAETLPKFFNFGQRNTVFKNLPYTCYEKLDGSMGALWHYNGQWNMSTRGSFTSPQAIKGMEILRAKYPNFEVSANEQITWLVEIIYPSNRIVVDYGNEEKLVLLAAFNRETHEEIEDHVLDMIAEVCSFQRPKRYEFASYLELQSVIKDWPKDQEGVVVRFSDGSRGKEKGERYKQLHKILSHFSPLSVWECVKDQNEFQYLEQLPDEFQDQYKLWKSEFESRADKLWANVVTLYEATKHLSDKELGIKAQAKQFGNMSGMIFAIRKNGADLNNKKARNWVFDQFRPTANVFKKFEE